MDHICEISNGFGPLKGPKNGPQLYSNDDRDRNYTLDVKKSITQRASNPQPIKKAR